MMDKGQEIPLYCGTAISYQGKTGRYEANFTTDGQAIKKATFIAEYGNQTSLYDGDTISLVR